MWLNCKYNLIDIALRADSKQGCKTSSVNVHKHPMNILYQSSYFIENWWQPNLTSLIFFLNELYEFFRSKANQAQSQGNST